MPARPAQLTIFRALKQIYVCNDISSRLNASEHLCVSEGRRVI